MSYRGNRKGLDCPFCGEPKSTLFVSQYPQAKAEGTTITVILPHEFAVCAGCYFAQFVRHYAPDNLDFAMTRGAEVRTQARDILRRRPEIEGGAEALALLLASESDDFDALGGVPVDEVEEPKKPVGTVEISGAELG